MSLYCDFLKNSFSMVYNIHMHATKIIKFLWCNITLYNPNGCLLISIKSVDIQIALELVFSEGLAFVNE